MPEKPLNKPEDQEKVKPQQKQEPETPLPDKQPHPNDQTPKKDKKKTPAQKKDDSLKYEMTYVNGGFNNGVQIKPDKDGKANVEISIYGGGEKKTLTISPLPKEISKLIKAYEISANQESDTPEITGELQRYFFQINRKLSRDVITILQEADQKIANAIKKNFKQGNN